MSLDLNRLEKVHKVGDKITARCPACATEGNDQKGEHLVIYSDGCFGCVVHPGVEGSAHRQEIFKAVGVADQERKPKPIEIRVFNPGPRRRVVL